MRNQFEDQFKQFITEWNLRLEELKVQFSLDKMDASDAFEKQKDNFRDLVVSLRENLDKASALAEENITLMRSKLDELHAQLNLGKAVDTDAFDKQKKKIEEAMQEVYLAGKKIFGNSFEQMLKLFDTNAQAFKTGLEIVRLQFSMGQGGDKDHQDNLRKEMEQKMEELNESFKRAQQIGKDNFDEWNRQMKEGYDRMKRFVDDWMK